MPRNTRNRCTLPLLARKDLVVHLATLPVPEHEVPATIAATNELAVRRHAQVYGVAGVVVAAELLFAVLPKAVGGRVDGDGVVEGLEEHFVLG